MFISHTAACTHHVGAHGLRKNSKSHIDASHSRQPVVKGERLVRYQMKHFDEQRSNCPVPVVNTIIYRPFIAQTGSPPM